MIYAYDLWLWFMIMIYDYDLWLWLMIMIYDYDLSLWFMIMIHDYDWWFWSHFLGQASWMQNAMMIMSDDYDLWLWFMIMIHDYGLSQTPFARSNQHPSLGPTSAWLRNYPNETPPWTNQ